MIVSSQEFKSGSYSHYRKATAQHAAYFSNLLGVTLLATSRRPGLQHSGPDIDLSTYLQPRREKRVLR